MWRRRPTVYRIYAGVSAREKPWQAAPPPEDVLGAKLLAGETSKSSDLAALLRRRVTACIPATPSPDGEVLEGAAGGLRPRGKPAMPPDLEVLTAGAARLPKGGVSILNLSAFFGNHFPASTREKQPPEVLLARAGGVRQGGDMFDLPAKPPLHKEVLITGAAGLPERGGCKLVARTSVKQLWPEAMRGRAGLFQAPRPSRGGAKILPGGSHHAQVFQRFYTSNGRPEFDPLPPPHAPSTDLLSVTKPCKTSIKSFNIALGDSQKLRASVESAKEQVSSTHLAVDRLKQTYHARVEAALEMRGVLSPFAMNDPKSFKLINAYKRILGLGRDPPICTSLYDVMQTLDSMHEDDWCGFFNHLSRDKVIVLKHWESLGTSGSRTQFDHGHHWAPYDSSPDYYRGETDASFHKEKGAAKGVAHICITIWRHDQIIDCIIYYDYECKDSIEAEATGMYLLQKRARQMGIDRMQAYTDNRIVADASRGLHLNHKHKELFSLLRKMSASFEMFMVYWVPRQNLVIPDWLTRHKFGYEGRLPMTAVSRNKAPYLTGEPVSRKLAPYLSGEPVFDINENHSDDNISLLNNKAKGAFFEDTEIDNSCYLEVQDESKKMDGLWHALVALRPGNTLYIATKGSSTSEQEIKDLVKSLYGEWRAECTPTPLCSLLTFQASHMPAGMKKSKKTLLVVLDASILKESMTIHNTFPALRKDNNFTVFISTRSERQTINECKLDPLSPMSFVSSHSDAVLKVQL